MENKGKKNLTGKPERAEHSNADFKLFERWVNLCCICILFTSVKTLSSNLSLIGNIWYLVDIFAVGIQKGGSKLLIFHLFLGKQS